MNLNRGQHWVPGLIGGFHYHGCILPHVTIYAIRPVTSQVIKLVAVRQWRSQDFRPEGGGGCFVEKIF